MSNISVPYVMRENFQNLWHVTYKTKPSCAMRFARFESSLVVDLGIVCFENSDMNDICSGISPSAQKWRTGMICARACAPVEIRQNN